MQSVRWGILGTARIADKVAAAIQRTPGSTLTAIASRSADKAASWAAEHHVSHHFGDYSALLASPSIDAVYVPLPPSMHAEWTIAAARAGKHVLCEKPLAVSVREAGRMAAACRDAGVQLMDATMWLHHERTTAMHDVITRGEIGPVSRVTAAMGFNAAERFTSDDIRFNPSLGGGALFDIGWYGASAILWAMGSLPDRVFAVDRKVDGVDRNTSVLAWWNDGRSAAFDCSFDLAPRKWFEVAGPAGSIVCDDFIAPWRPESARYWLHADQGKASVHAFEGGIQEERMIACFAEIVRRRQPDPFWSERSLMTQQLVCAAAASIAKNAPVSPDMT
jgi:predicted dehydrogenase